MICTTALLDGGPSDGERVHIAAATELHAPEVIVPHGGAAAPVRRRGRPHRRPLAADRRRPLQLEGTPVIRPKPRKLTAAEEKQAYAIATGRDDETCQKCLRDCGPIARDHRQNRQPGNTVASNLCLLGLGCHIWKTEHPADAIAEGWAVPRWADPARWPARRWFRSVNGVTSREGWALYDDAGGITEITERQAHDLMEGAS